MFFPGPFFVSEFFENLLCPVFFSEETPSFLSEKLEARRRSFC